MHLGNGAITPECVAITVSAASAGLGLCAWSVGRQGASVSKLGLAAALGVFAFAAQSVNVPILPGISAHLVGGVLLAWALGPAIGALTMAVVLAVQAMLLGDGGTLALGANIVNMAIIPAALVAIARRFNWLSFGSFKANPREMVVIGALSALAVVAAAGLIAVEVALFRSGSELVNWSAFAQQMLSVHLLVAVGEGSASVMLAAALACLASSTFGRTSILRPALAAAAMAMLAALAIPLSSELPDGYEHAARQSGQTNWLE